MEDWKDGSSTWREIAQQTRSQDSALFLQSTAELVEKFAKKSGE